MQSTWREEYSKLASFLVANPAIVARPDLLRIPADLRDEFNQLFDNVRNAFLNEEAGHLIAQAKVLSHNYIEAENKACKLLGLTEVRMLKSLSRFLHEPSDRLKREIYNPLNDLLKDKIDEEEFQETVRFNINQCFNRMYLKGYGKWIMMSLINVFQADELLFSPLPEVSVDDLQKINPAFEIDLLEPKPVKIIDFERAVEPACNISDFIIHSGLTGKYVSVAADFGDPYGRVKERCVSQKREWLAIKGNPLEWQDLVLIYQDETPRDVQLVNEWDVLKKEVKIARPNILIINRPFENWAETSSLEEINDWHNTLMPEKGTFVFSMEKIEEPLLSSLAGGVKVVDGNYLSEILEVVAATLLPFAGEEMREREPELPEAV